jgi:hypothetical protein
MCKFRGQEIIQLGYNTARVALGQWLADEAPDSIRESLSCNVAKGELVKQADDVQIVKVWMLGISAFSQQAFACCKLLCSNSNKSEIVRRSLVFHVVSCFIYIS